MRINDEMVLYTSLDRRVLLWLYLKHFYSYFSKAVVEVNLSQILDVITHFMRKK